MQVSHMASRREFAVEQCSRTQRREEIVRKARLTPFNARRRCTFAAFHVSSLNKIAAKDSRDNIRLCSARKRRNNVLVLLPMSEMFLSFRFYWR